MTDNEKIAANALMEANGDPALAIKLAIELGRELLKTPEQRRREALYDTWATSQRDHRDPEPRKAFLAGYFAAVAEITLFDSSKG